MGFHLALGIFLRGVAEGEGVVAEDHRAARSEGLHVQAGIGTAMSRPALEPPQALWGGSMEGGFTGKDSLLAGEAGRDSAAPSSPEGETTLLARQGDSTHIRNSPIGEQRIHDLGRKWHLCSSIYLYPEK